jgi:hypothetical protein
VIFEILLRMAKIDRLKKNGLKAGIRTSKREGHVLTREELLEMKIQMMPSFLRWITGSAGVAGMGYAIFVGEFSVLWFLLGLLFLVLGIFGYRKTLSTVIDNIGEVSGEVVVRLILEGMVAAVGSVFD